MADLDKLRREINAVDERILEALSLRRDLANRVIQTKADQQMPLRDAGREEEMLSRLISRGREHGLDAHFVTRVFHEIIDDSIRSQQLFLIRTGNQEPEGERRVGFQGIEGAYSHLAAQKFFSHVIDRTRFTGYPTFPEVVQAVEQEVADYGFLPIENTTAGSINEVYDLLSNANLSIVGEEVFRVDHCLLAVEEVPTSSIRRVLSHPQALTQCMKFLSQLKDCQREYYPDTAMAVLKVKEDGNPTQAAIASEEAARRYGLKVIQRDLADQRDNYTRFLVFARRPIKVDLRIPAKTSLIIATPHEEGSLLRALSVLHKHRINLTKLESRPMPGTPFQYLFYIDFEGNIASEQTMAALDELSGTTSFLKILGSYPREARGRTPPNVQALVARELEAATARAPADATTADPKSQRLVSRSAKRTDTVITVKGVRLGGQGFVVIAGPSMVESREQILACARQVRECGGRVLRGGCFRSQASPRGFQGLGLEGLHMLADAGRAYELPVVTEVLTPSDVKPVAGLADILLIGARNMQNYALLKEVGNVNRPVLLKRGPMSTLEELLEAAEYILSQGNKQVILCERGIRTFETATRNTLDLASIPVLKRRTHLPVLVDPARAAGQRDLVPPLARAARALGPHGALLEVHPEPGQALVDGAQALDFEGFARLMRELYAGD